MDGYSPEQFHQYLDRVSRCVRYVSSERAEEFGFKYYYIPFLLAIRNQPGISQKILCESIPLDKSRVSIVVRELIRSGYVRNDSTGKVWSINLTPSGEAVSRKAEEIVNDLNGKLFEGIGREDLDVFLRVMGEISERADAISAGSIYDPADLPFQDASG